MSDDSSAQPPDACWLVELAGVDGRRYAYRVYASKQALPGDLFWSALHHHDAGPLPRALDLFDTALIRLLA
ncbi:hypothetical protein [Kitasatospora sp. NBC_01266]|uniref:hypothetical protein n=1 Tax=Kitasatospora sp. NBC_01266 TaxID=2903572 RepID=UPI002E302AA1|nr:hypothetical protein [Kitasatospora sp. NBC_01266]